MHGDATAARPASAARAPSLGRRMGAVLYDSLLVFALMFLATTPFVWMSGGESVAPGTLPHQLAMLFVAWLFFAGFWTRFGRTLGMQSWRLRIETTEGAKPSLARSTLRFAAALLSWLPAGLGFWWQLRDRDGLTWHDRLSGTRLRH